MQIRIRNVPAKMYKRFLKEARRHKNSLEDEVRGTIFMHAMEQHRSQRSLLFGRLSRCGRLRFLKRERA